MPTYIVKATVANIVTNASEVTKGAHEGRTVPPLVIPYNAGDRVELSEGDAERYLEVGAVEKPGESQRAQADLRNAEADRLRTQADQLASQAKSADQEAKSLLASKPKG